MAAELPSDDGKTCADFTPQILREGSGSLTGRSIVNGITALAPLPVQTARIFCAWFDSEATGQMSRSDTLWFQAGYGGAPGDIGSGAPAFPKWDSPNPSLFRVLPGDTGHISPYSNPFPPGTGTGR